MKKLFTLFYASMFTLGAFAQYGGNTVTIDIKGNQDIQVMVDGRNYSSSDYDNDRRGKNDRKIVVRNLQPGQHSLQLVSNDYRRNDKRNTNNRNNDRSNKNDRRYDNSNNNLSYFTIRQGFDMDISISNNGSLAYRETRIKNNRGKWNNDRSGYDNDNGMYKPNTYGMSDISFNELQKDIRGRWFNGSKVTAVNAAFANTNNYFTASQAKQLIQLVTGENERLGLAKASIRSLVDLNNINTFYDLFSSQSSMNELNAYARNSR